ncbi:uncharacterized protein LOC131666521 isoform X2 [Phymastichus coffea]|uniref:uncharacterized protein LOC131666521 isoform X2 n=1 Tax=Phymastichus coffea TaxID=108790 RepID=UPI00273B409C|nr:uncharacterized protein LOC131666521 isoform X2 [Phymastichus coffea]
MTTSSFTCYQCDKGNCNVPDEQMFLCKTEFNCWKSLTEFGSSQLESRGCIPTAHHDLYLCNNTKEEFKPRDLYRCCAEEFCNDGNFAVIEDLERRPPPPRPEMIPLRRVNVRTSAW